MDRDTVLKLLESEIGLLTQRQRNTGWTSWAVLGALGAIGWLLLGQWQAGWPQGDKWLHAFAAASFTAFFVEALVRILKTGKPLEGPIKRFRYANSQGHARAAMAHATLYAGALFAVVRGWDPFPSVPRAILLVLTGGFFVFCIFALTMYLTRTVVEESGPEQEDTSLGFKAVVILLVLGSMAVPVVLTLRELFAQAPDGLDLKVGVLLAVASFVTRVGLEESSGGTTLENLLRIRRELALGGMTVEDATQRIEFEFLGMKVSDLIRDSAREFLRRVDQVNTRCRSRIVQVDAAELPLLGGGGLLSREQIHRVRALLTEGQTELQGLEKQLEKLRGEYAQFPVRNARYLQQATGGWSAMSEVFVTLSISLAAADRHVGELRSKLQPLEAAVSAHPER